MVTCYRFWLHVTVKILIISKSVFIVDSVSGPQPKSDGYPQVANTVSGKSSVSEKETKANGQEKPRPKSEVS